MSKFTTKFYWSKTSHQAFLYLIVIKWIHSSKCRHLQYTRPCKFTNYSKCSSFLVSFYWINGVFKVGYFVCWFSGLFIETSVFVELLLLLVATLRNTELFTREINPHYLLLWANILFIPKCIGSSLDFCPGIRITTHMIATHLTSPLGWHTDNLNIIIYPPNTPLI